MSNKPEDKNLEQEDKSTVDLSRRRLTKVGLIAAPILTTLPGKSALAGNCTTLSGMLSGNMSAQDGINEPCDGEIDHNHGLSPGYWRTVCNNKHVFPLPYTITKKCTDLGNLSGHTTMHVPSGLSDYTIFECLWLQNKQTNVPWELCNLTRHSIAGLFNSIEFDDYFLSTEQLIEIYNALVSSPTGVYIEPITGESITIDEFIGHLDDSYVGSSGVSMMNSVEDCEDFKQDPNNGYIYIKEDDGKFCREYSLTETYYWDFDTDEPKRKR